MTDPTQPSLSLPDRSVRLANLDDLPFVVELQKKFRLELGFLTRSALTGYIERQQCIVILENGQHAGYLNWNLHHKGLFRTSQIAVTEELLRSKVGSTMHNFMEKLAKECQCGVMRAIPRGDIYANEFFADKGYMPTGTFQICNKQRIPHIEYTKQLYVPAAQARSIAIDRSQQPTSHGKKRVKIHPAFIETLASKPNEYIVAPSPTEHYNDNKPTSGLLFDAYA